MVREGDKAAAASLGRMHADRGRPFVSPELANNN
jgi:hypothetical protein